MKSWKATLLKPSDSIEKAIHVLERVGSRIVMVADRDGDYWAPLAMVIPGALIRKQCTDTSLDKIMNNCHIAPGVTLSGGVTVGNCTHIGAGSVVIQNISICENSIIAEGSVMFREQSQVLDLSKKMNSIY